MATAGGPDIERNGLVFGYDTSYGINTNNITSRFYPGGPTTNSAILDMTTYAKDNGSTVTATGELYLGQPVYRVYFPPGTLPRIRFDFSHTSGQTWNGSIHYKVVQSGDFMPQLIFRQTGFGTTYTSTPLTSTNWTRANINYTFSTNNNSMFLLYRSTSSSTQPVYIDFAMPQLEQKPYATPFTTGTRSSTQSLIDLTRTSTIDVSNVSFDSTGQPTFDGTDDHITGTLPINGNGAPHTIEMVFSSNVNQGSLGGRRDPFTIGNSTTHQYSALDVNTSNMNWYFYGKDTSFTNSPQMVANQYYHIVLSYAGGFSNNTNKKVWFNGVQQTLSAGVNETSLLPDNPSFSVGRDRGRNTAYWPGKIPVFKVYNQALTAQEVQQNYNAYKNRFNI
jgi:hypothetical protein